MTNVVTQYFKDKKVKKKLKAQIEECKKKYLLAMRGAVEKVGKLPEGQRKVAQSQLQDWQQQYVAAQVTGKPRDQTARELDELCTALSLWTPEKPPTSGTQQPSPPQTPPTPSTDTPPLDAQALKPLCERVKLIVGQAEIAQLKPAPLLTAVIEQAGKQVELGGQARPEGLQQADKALRDVLAVEGELLAFCKAWINTENVESRAKATPPPAAPDLLDNGYEAWKQARSNIGGDWEKLGDPRGTVGLNERLQAAARTALESRSELLHALAEANKAFADVQGRLDELNVGRLVDLRPATAALNTATAALKKAADQGGITAALQLLKAAELSIDSAAQGLQGPKGEALARYQKLRQKVQNLLNAAGKFRGASDPMSKVYEIIDEGTRDLLSADQLLAQALTSGQVDAACEPLRKVLDSDLLSRAEKLSKAAKKQFEKDQKALPDYQQKFDELRQMRAQVAELPGAEKQRNALDLLIAQCRVESGGSPAGGFAAALKRMQDGKPQDLVDEAQKATRSFTTKTLPNDAIEGMEAARKELEAYALCHTPFELAQRRQQLARAAEDPTPAKAIETFTVELIKATESQQRKGEGLIKMANGIAEDLRLLQVAGLLPTDPGLLTILQRVDEARKRVASWSLEDAETSLTQLLDLTRQLTQTYGQAVQVWDEAQQDLDNFKSDSAILLKAWGGVRNQAADLIDSVDSLRKQLNEKKIDHREAAARATRLLTELLPGLKQLQQEAGLTDTGKLAGFDRKRQDLQKSWLEKAALIRQRLQSIDAALRLAGVKEGSRSLPHGATLDQLDTAWGKAQASMKLQQGEDPSKALQDLYDPLELKLDELLKALPNPQNPADPKDKALEGSIELGKQTETHALWRKTHATALGLLREIEADDLYAKESQHPSKLTRPKELVDPGPIKVLLGEHYDEKTVDPKRATAWRELAEIMAKWLAARRQEVRAQKGPMLEEAVKLKDEVKKKLLSRESVKFRALFDDITLRLDDALLMLQSDDVSLVKAAERQITEIRLMVQDAKGKGVKGAVTLGMLDKRHADLSHLLGDGYHVQKRMPQTYARLKPLLDKTWVEVKGLPPEEGMRKLEALQQPIMDARKQAKALTLRYEGFKLVRKQIEELHGQLKDHTGTTLIDGRTKAYNERFTARLNEAHALARQEGRLEDGFKALKTIEDELRDMLAMEPPAARGKLLKLDAEEADAQRELRDLARRWNATEDYWKDTGLPEVKKAVEKRGGDLGEYQSLNAAVLNIGKTLDPYLSVVSAVPHKRGLSNGAPDMKVARSTFSQAYMRLGQLQKVAQRLLAGNSSTNVELVGDLNELKQEWTGRTERLAADMARLARELGELPQQADTDTAAATDDKRKHLYLSTSDKTTLLEALKSVEQSLKTMSTRFPADTFDAALSVLADDKAGADQKLKAREEALRRVNRLTADVAGNAFLRELFAGAASGMLQADPRASIGLLRASLKKIELAALVNV